MEHLPTIHVTTIPHHWQAYDTAGDYGGDDNFWWVSVSKLSDWRYEVLVLIHELVEMALTVNDGVSWDAVTAFDTGPGKNSDDPGTLPDAPYFKQHAQATIIEKLVATMLGVDWDSYDASFVGLQWTTEEPEP